MAFYNQTPQAQPSPFPPDGLLSGRGGQSLQIPPEIWEILPELQRANLANVFANKGANGVSQYSEGQPWGEELMAALGEIIRRRQGMTRQPMPVPPSPEQPKSMFMPSLVNANESAAFNRPEFPGSGSPQGRPFNQPVATDAPPAPQSAPPRVQPPRPGVGNQPIPPIASSLMGRRPSVGGYQ